jgi:hypothetical protein
MFINQLAIFAEQKTGKVLAVNQMEITGIIRNAQQHLQNV